MCKSRVARVWGVCLGLFLGLSVGSVQAALIADAGPDLLDQVEGSLIQIDGTGSHDTDGLPFTYLWEQTDGPSATLFTPTDATLFVNLPIVGAAGAAFIFSLTVDNGSATDSDFVNVFINESN